MTKNKVLILAVIIGLLMVGAAVMAPGPGLGQALTMMGSGGMGMGGMGRGMMDGRGFGWGGQGNYPQWNQQRPAPRIDEEAARLEAELSRRRAGLDSVLSEEDPDIERAKSLQRDINALQKRLDERRGAFRQGAERPGPNQWGGYGWNPALRGRWQ